MDAARPGGRKQLTDWDTAWVPWILPQLQAAIAARPKDEILAQIEKEVLADPQLASVYEAGGALFHPDGHERPLCHTHKGPGWVSICAAQPMTAPGSRLFILIFRPGEGLHHTRPPMIRAR
ncbi:hypothetical protein ACFQ0Q_42385 [Streptomyces aureus]